MLTRNRVVVTIFVAVVMLGVSGCVRERPSDNPPIHINPNMDNQPKYRPQSESKFFADGATMRVPPAGTVAEGDLRSNIEYCTGKNANGEFVETIPDTVSVNLPLLRRGQERFNIYCSPCHGRVGDGKGIMVNRGYVPPPTFHSDRIRELHDGQIFDVITHGVRNMPAYMYQVPVDDRWAIVAYLRALQRSQNAAKEDIPQTMQDKVR
ncbi:MAG: cytochrome c [Candidatus Zixiibacteriota bacterium]|nr:MAG: cytochrome c [candidate division Zixibacteria bacterium]